MHKNILPLKVDPFRFAEQQLSLQGELPIHKLSRLLPSLSSEEGEINVDMQFGVDEQDISFLKGRLTATLMLQCQRCMSPFKYEIINNFMFGFTSSEEKAAEIPAYYDPVVIEEGVLWINDIFEEELLVSLPVVPAHAPSECKVTLPYEFHSEDVSGAKRENPFKVIELLRSKRK